MLRILIAGGGTGGHIFPALAIAERVLQEVPHARIEFVGTKQGLEKKLIPQRNFRLHYISTSGLYRVSLPKKLLSLLTLPLSFLQSVFLLLRFRPTIVLGVGGYASGPLLLGALFLRRTVVIQEQNAHPGMVNRVLGKYADLAFVPFEPAAGLFKHYHIVGNPIRQDICALAEEPVPQTLTAPKIRFGITGGSRGARILNQVLPQSLALLSEYSDRFTVKHQTGVADYQKVKEGYKAAGCQVQVFPFIDDMAGFYRDVDLIISRAGAGIFELNAAGKAGILVPIPWASGDHQKNNALTLCRAGAAIMIEEDELTPEGLAEAMRGCIEQPQRILEMSRASRAMFCGDSAAKITAILLERFYTLQQKP